MRQCPRCNHWHHSVVSNVCDKCWEDMGQMQFWHDDSNDPPVPPRYWREDAADNDDEYLPPIDTVFDREEEARGYQ